MKHRAFAPLASAIVSLGILFSGFSLRADPGDLYVVESSSAALLKIAPDGTKSVFGSGLDGPRGLAFDRAGNVFVSEIVIGNNTSEGLIHRFTPDGIGSIFASGLGKPTGMAFDASGNL